MKSLDSASTGWTAPTSSAESLPRDGFSAGRTVAVTSAVDTQAVAKRLASRSPAEVNSLLVSSVQQCGVTLREAIEARGGYEMPDGSMAPVSYSRRYVVDGASLSDIEAAREKVAHAMTPPTRSQVEGWLAELSVITARREDDQMTEALRLAAYSNRLSDYPADVVRHALLAHRWKFFPSWMELAQVCDEGLKHRKQMLREIERAEREARDAEIRARALPTEATVTLTSEEVAARKAETDRLIAESLAKLKSEAKAQADEQREQEAVATAGMWKSRPEPVSQEAAE